jgi:uncharacterized protein HemX
MNGIDWEWLKRADVLIGLILTLSGLGAGISAWFYRRMKRIAREVSPVDLQTARSVKDVQAKLERIDSHIEGYERRLSDVERRMETLATSADVGKLDSKVSGLAAEVRVVSGMVDTLYQAVLAANRQ